jgi:hypothetical protein
LTLGNDYRKIDEPKTPFVSSNESFPDLGKQNQVKICDAGTNTGFAPFRRSTRLRVEFTYGREAFEYGVPS